MRLSRFAIHLASISILVPGSTGLLAQEISPASHGVGAVAGVLSGASAAAQGCSEVGQQGRIRPIEPYTANQKTTTVQILANGTTITRETIAKEARDSSGRTFHESVFDFPTGDVETGKQSMFNVFDPVNHISINWSTQSKVANVFHMPEPAQMRQAQTRSSPARPSQWTGLVYGAIPPTPAAPLQPIREDLGTKNINGLEAKGNRMTTTYPVGRVGNDQPFTVTHETWVSEELMLAVMQIDDDPRTGVRTMELTDIERGEPDPALFQVPEGYTVKDQYPNQQN
jgi:hypothetical protein